MICSNLEIVENNEKLTSKDLVQKMEAYCLEMQQCIESFFMRIDNLLDQIINDSFNSFNQNLEQSQQAMLHQQFILFPSLAIPRFWNQQFGNELIHSISSLLKFSIENQIKKNVEEQFRKRMICLDKELESSLRNYSKELAFSIKFKQQDRQILEKGKIALAYKMFCWYGFVINLFQKFNSGICFRDIISKDYQGQTSEIGHGYYLMCKDGYLYSHHEKGFKLKVNDIIKITFDLKQQIIKWENLKSNQSQTLTLETNYGLYSCFRLASSKVLLIE